MILARASTAARPRPASIALALAVALSGCGWGGDPAAGEGVGIEGATRLVSLVDLLCEPTAETVCADEAVWTVDRCGRLDHRLQDCPAGSACVEVPGGARCASSCGLLTRERVCHEGDVYLLDVCGQPSARVVNCPMGAPCTGGAEPACGCHEDDAPTRCGGEANNLVVATDSCGAERVIEHCGPLGGCVEAAEGAACDCGGAADRVCVDATVSPGLPAQAVVEVDACGGLLDTLEVCPPGASCDASAPPGERCGCAPDVALACFGAELRWADACGGPGALVEACAAPELCLSSGGTAACGCAPTLHTGCAGGDVFTLNGCGAPISRARACPAGATCTEAGHDADCGGVRVDLTTYTSSPDATFVLVGLGPLGAGQDVAATFEMADGYRWAAPGTCTLRWGGVEPHDPILWLALSPRATAPDPGLTLHFAPWESQAQFEAAPCGEQRSFFFSCASAEGEVRSAGDPIVLEKRCL